MSSDALATSGYDEGKRQWPGLVVERAAFDRMLRDTEATLDGMAWAGDFYLACAAGGGDAEAIRIIDERFVARMPVRLRRLGSKPEAIADVLQTVRERLFAGAEPRIRTYDARGPLEQWIKVVAMRTAIDMHRNAEAAPRAESAWLDTLSTVCPDTTTLLARAECKARLEAAIREEVATLPPREKAVLRLHVVEGVSVEKIALSYGVHRVTVARWIWTAGETLLDGLQRRFRDSLGIAPSELTSLARLARSQLSLNLAELLAG